ncbi:MAG: hypothetical protein R6X27_05960 [Candidatus Desulfacyla sp.]
MATLEATERFRKGMGHYPIPVAILAGLAVSFGHQGDEEVDIYFIVFKKTPSAEGLMGRMETGYQALKADGKLSDIPSSPGVEDNPQKR